LLGSALYALGDLPAAEEALRRSLCINPGYADASCDLGARPLMVFNAGSCLELMTDRMLSLLSNKCKRLLCIKPCCADASGRSGMRASLRDTFRAMPTPPLAKTCHTSVEGFM
jgi:hypothetical protein